MSDDLAKQYLDAKKGLRPGPFPTLPGMNVRPRYVVHEHDLDHLAARITALEAENKRLSEALRDDRHARALASERRVDELNEENKRLREALEPFAKEFTNCRLLYAKRYRSEPIEHGFAIFDKMPDEWPMEKPWFDMGTFRRAVAALEKK